jgi:hypothetical protein
MSENAVPVTSIQISTSSRSGCDATQSKGPRKIGRALSKSALAALMAAAALSVTAVGGATAYADTLTNGPTITIGNYPIPGTAPAYVPGVNVLPASPGAPSNGAVIFMAGSAADGTNNDTYAIGVPGGSPNWGTQVSTAKYTGATASQTWYFQQVGYVGLNTELAGYTSTLWDTSFLQEAAVYRIVNYDNGTYTCLDGFGNNPIAGSIVDSYGCNPNQVNQTNQLWVVGNPSQESSTMSTSGGPGPDGYSVAQDFSSYLGYDDSVIENVASLVANGWNTTTAPVLSATYSDLAGINSGLQLQAQTYPAEPMNSTWDIEPAYTPPPANTSNPVNPSPCAGLSGYVAVLCWG